MRLEELTEGLERVGSPKWLGAFRRFVVSVVERNTLRKEGVGRV